MLLPVKFLGFIHNEEWMVTAGYRTGLEKHALCMPRVTCFPTKLLRCPFQKLVQTLKIDKVIPILGVEALSAGMG